MENRFRCSCPVTTALDVVGDKWTLVIIKQMLLEDARTFKDFSNGDEHIASNILSTRLKMLEEIGMIWKTKLPDNKKTNIYLLTDKGLGLTPIIIELILWTDGHLRDLHPDARPPFQAILDDKESAIDWFISNYEEKNASFIKA